jgi:hypothetical protein
VSSQIVSVPFFNLDVVSVLDTTLQYIIESDIN